MQMVLVYNEYPKKNRDSSMKYIILLSSLSLFFSHSVYSDICQSGNSYYEAPSCNAVNANTALVINEVARLENYFKSAKVNPNKLRDAEKYAIEHNLIEEYNGMLKHYKAWRVNMITTYEQRRQQIALEQQRKQQIAQQRRQLITQQQQAQVRRQQAMPGDTTMRRDTGTYYDNGSSMSGPGGTMHRNGPFTNGPNETFMDNGPFMNGSNGTTCFRNGPFVNCN